MSLLNVIKHPAITEDQDFRLDLKKVLESPGLIQALVDEINSYQLIRNP